MIISKKAQSMIFTFDQIIDSGLVFLFIAIGGNILGSSEMASVVVDQSIALVCVLFCSCFTTQYLLLRYKEQGHRFWLKLILFFAIITSGVIVFLFESYLILSLFLVGIISEFGKRYCYYSDQALISLYAVLTTAFIYCFIILMSWLKLISFDADSYIYFYSAIKFTPLLIMFFVLIFKIDSKDSEIINENFYLVVQDSLKLGGIFAIITIVYWIINQGFFIIFKDRIPASELVNLRITQNVFGIVTMLITLYDSIFLKNNIDNQEKIFSFRTYFQFVAVALSLIVVNLLILYLFSVTIYSKIDVFKYALYLSLAQLFYLLARMPVLILKLRYNLTLILILYVVSLCISLIYMFLNRSSADFQYIVQSIALANFLVLFFSLVIVFKKEKRYG
jgi:hypothetical protein